MTPPEHLFIGFSLGNVFYSIQIFFKRTRLPYIAIIVFCGIFAVLPDIDSFFGKYGSKDVFIGHRGITHSVFFICAASACFAVLYGVIVSLLHPAFRSIRKRSLLLFVIIFLSGFSHLLMDLPQPPGAWGGIPLLFPLSENGEYTRIGGFSLTGWYDYMIQWLFFFLFMLSLVLVVIGRISGKQGFSSAVRTVAAVVILVNLLSYAWTFDYISRSRYVNARQWAEIQERHLSELGPVVRSVTLKGRKFFLAVFRRVTL